MAVKAGRRGMLRSYYGIFDSARSCFYEYTECNTQNCMEMYVSARQASKHDVTEKRLKGKFNLLAVEFVMQLIIDSTLHGG